MQSTQTREAVRLINTEDNGRAVFIIRNGDEVKLSGGRRADAGGDVWETVRFPVTTEAEAADTFARLEKAFVGGGLYVGFRR